MAFLRQEQKKSGTYLRILQSVRKNGKSTHKTLFSLGKVEDYTPEQLQSIGRKLYEIGGGDIRKLLGDKISELGRYNYGFYQLYSKIYAHYGLAEFFSKLSKRNALSYDLSNDILLMLLERLNDPCSKRRNYFNQAEYLGLEEADLHHLYRSLDYIADNAELIQTMIYQTDRNLFNQHLDVVFYDVTTFYFDSDKEGGLRQKGFSKDGKHSKTQVVFGLLIDKNKQPIGYNLYKGNFYEGHSFPDAVAQLKSRYMIDKIVVVADRGMLNKTNLDVVTSHDGYEFIVGERLKSLPQKLQDYLLDRKNYKKTWTYTSKLETIALEYATVEYQGRKVICTYSPKRARKDKYEREKHIEKGLKLLKNQSKIISSASRYYLESDQKNNYKLNEKKIEKAKRFDGFIAIATNNQDQPEELILDHYKHLYRIEHCFRSFKSYLETRPMFHWTDKRIEGHICLCYMAFAMLFYVLNKLELKEEKMTEDSLRRTLNKMQVSHVKQGKSEYYLRSKSTSDTEKITNIFNLKKIPDFLPKSLIFKYL